MNIAIYPNLDKKNAGRCTQEVINILKKNDVNIYLDNQYKNTFANFEKINYGDFVTFFKSCDIIIVIGGDGTIIKCAQIISETDVPLLAINSGRLGFMASLEENELNLINRVLNGDYSTIKRMMINGRIVYKNGKEKIFSALNDIVVSKENLCKLADFEVSVNSVTVSSVRADGLIFSTPTGSTAYSLSAGGPIIEPTCECIEFTQICPFSLLARTMIFSPDKVIKVQSGRKGETIVVSPDGCDEIPITNEDELYIYKSENYVRFIEINGSNFYRSVNNKLMQPLKSNKEVDR